jgi:phage gpG-like protein
MQFSVQVRGDEAAARRLDKLGNNAERARPVLTKLVGEILAIQEVRFQRNQGMKATKASTKATDRRQNRDLKPLRSTGALKDSVTRVGGPNQTLVIDNNSLKIGTTLSYARFHQYGIGVPKRKVINLTPRQRKDLSETILNYIVDDE